jgi:AraC-like DNA-binding protein
VIASDRKAIGFLTEPNSTGLRHCGIEVTRNDLLVHGSDLLHQRSEFGLSYGSMSVPMKDFLGLYETLTGREFLIDPCTTIVRPDPPLMSRLLRLHKTMEWLAHDTPEILDLAEVDRALEEQLIHLMVRCLASGKAVETTTGDRRHGAIMRKFEAFLEAYPNRPLYLTDICAGIGVAERTLRAACEEHLGIGPIRYLALRRMHLVRRSLLEADASNTSVTRIITNHGFWELGRFSVAYRALFEESPSETLRRPGQQLKNYLNRPSLPVKVVAGGPN